MTFPFPLFKKGEGKKEINVQIGQAQHGDDLLKQYALEPSINGASKKSTLNKGVEKYF